MEKSYTTREKLENWLYYNWWIPVLVLFLLVVGGSMIVARSEQDRTKADYRVAYVGYQVLEGEMLEAAEWAFVSLGTDVNGDGMVTVSISQYITGDQSGFEGAYYGRAAEVALLADLDEGESYFFLLDEPEAFQKSLLILANPDGSPAAEDDTNVADKVFACGSLPAFAGLETENPLYLGRRCFLNPDMEANSNENAALWAALTDTTP